MRCDGRRVDRTQRAQHLHFLVAHLGGVETRRRFHRDQRQQLQHVVLNHVAQRAGLVIKRATALQAHCLGHGDLNVVDPARVPQRLEQPVAEAQRQQILHRLLAEIVVYAKRPLLREGR